MYAKIFLVAVSLAVCTARPQSDHGHEHGHAYSSQSIVLHQNHEHKHEHQPTHKQTQEHHHQAHKNTYEHHHAPATSAQHVERHDVPGAAPAGHHEHYTHPKYEFAYKVEDPHTGDRKAQHEARDGDVVKGFYSLHEADGTVRVVHYTADKKTGFNAEVKYEGPAKHETAHHQ